MKEYDETIKSVFEKGDEILAARKKRGALIRRITFSVSGICAAAVIGFGIWHSDGLRHGMDNNFDNDNIIVDTTNTTEKSTSTSTTSSTSRSTKKSEKSTKTTSAETKAAVTETKERSTSESKKTTVTQSEKTTEKTSTATSTTATTTTLTTNRSTTTTVTTTLITSTSTGPCAPPGGAIPPTMTTVKPTDTGIPTKPTSPPVEFTTNIGEYLSKKLTTVTTPLSYDPNVYVNYIKADKCDEDGVFLKTFRYDYIDENGKEQTNVANISFIKDIPEKTAILLSFGDWSDSYLYYNNEERYATLGDWLTAYNIPRRLVISQGAYVSRSHYEPNVSTVIGIYGDIDIKKLCDRLGEMSDSANIIETFDGSGYRYFSMAFSLDKLPIGGNMTIYENGKLLIQTMQKKCAFDIGEERANALIKELTENSKKIL